MIHPTGQVRRGPRTLEDLIYERLTGPDGPGGKLARFAGKPAVFYQYAPDDTDEGWEGDQYPRIDYVVDMQANPERHTSGAMVVNIWSRYPCFVRKSK